MAAATVVVPVVFIPVCFAPVQRLRGQRLAWIYCRPVCGAELLAKLGSSGWADLRAFAAGNAFVPVYDRALVGWRKIRIVEIL